MKTDIYFLSYLSHFLELEMFQTKVVEKIKIDIFENRVVYEVMQKDMVDPDRPQMAI